MKWPHGKTIWLSGKRYLTRYFLWGRDDSTRYNIYLHRIYRDDPDRRPHNHPWPWFFSIVLWGWYNEQRYENGLVTSQRVRLFNKFPGRNVFHRITDVSRRPCWTLILVPPKSTREWGYASASGFIPHSQAHQQNSAKVETF